MKLKLEKVADRGEKMYKVLEISGIMPMRKMPKTIMVKGEMVLNYTKLSSGDVRAEIREVRSGGVSFARVEIKEGEIYTEQYIEEFIQKATKCIEAGKRAEEEARELERTWRGEVEFIVR